MDKILEKIVNERLIWWAKQKEILDSSQKR